MVNRPEERPFLISTQSRSKGGDSHVHRFFALVIGTVFSLGVGLAALQANAQTPAPKEEKKSEMKKDEMKKGEKKMEKKAAKKKAEKKMAEKKMEKKDEKK